jgi:Signal transduction histidine kinase
MQEYKKYVFTFGRKLFLSVLGLFLVFIASFFFFLYLTEKDHKVELLTNKLQNINDNVHIKILSKIDEDLPEYMELLCIKNLRLTILNVEGKVLYDNALAEIDTLNLSDRLEIQEALKDGRGTDVRRMSVFLGIPYFFSATKYDDYIIRTAIPYTDELVETLKADYHYVWFALIIIIVLIYVFYKITENLGVSINQLRQFAVHIDKNEPFDSLTNSISGNDELSEISQHIIRIYQRLHDTKEALYIEREKLITHLQTSREGLGVFTKDKTEILVNSLFTKYANIISDTNLENSEDLFKVPELQPVVYFIQKAQKRPLGKGEERIKINIQKNGLILMVKCIIFQDMSFEISINDVSQEEQQSLLKRQLTQNIAHELKTPVSSIQAYLETIVNNPDLSLEKEQIFLMRCYEQSNRLSRLLRDISVLTRMDEAPDMVELEKLDVSTIVSNIINELALELEKKNITIINNLKKRIEIRGNNSLIYSIFRNLMDNSIAYAGVNIQIIINNFREDENFYYFSFADTGIGIGSEHLQRLFERFYRIDKGRSRKLGGTGLGLAIVKNAVIIHGGTISAKKYQGGGLEFIFTLGKDK